MLSGVLRVNLPREEQPHTDCIKYFSLTPFEPNAMEINKELKLNGLQIRNKNKTRSD